MEADVEERSEHEGIEELDEPTKKFVPKNVLLNGELRHLRLSIDHGDDDEKVSAIDRVKTIIHQHSNLGYANILAERYDVSGGKISRKTSFSIAFEAALRDQDAKILDMLSERFPRLIALTTVAKAMFGDETAAAEVAGLMQSANEESHPSVGALKRRLEPQLQLIEGGKPALSVLSDDINDVQQALYDANEAGVDVWSIAA
ncbi:MAG: hypothetical protein HN719_00365 [Alphaproteobacteria bacterium]|nr:hypothetical protein [Alphaproteobacteria bacterium]